MQLHRVITFIPFIVNEDREAPTFSGLVRERHERSLSINNTLCKYRKAGNVLVK